MATELYDPRIPPREACIVGEAIDRWARDNPDKVFVMFADGTSWTFQQLRDVVRQTALGLQQLGVKQGDYVIWWLPNGPDALRVSFAINYGAINVPANLAYRGNLLAHVVRNSQAKLIVLHADLLPRLDDIDCAALTQAWCSAARRVRTRRCSSIPQMPWRRNQAALRHPSGRSSRGIP